MVEWAMPGPQANGVEPKDAKKTPNGVSGGGTDEEGELFLPKNWSHGEDGSETCTTPEEEEEEEGSGGTGGRVAQSSTKGQFRARLKQNIWRTLSNGFAVFVLGVMISMKGPTFIDIQNISDTDVEGGSFYVTASAFGYMTGSFIAGGLYDRVKSRYLLMFIALLLSAASFAVTPLCSNFVLMLFVSAVVSVFCALFETTANAEEVHAWEGNSGSAMQFLSFNYSFGGIVGPLIAEPFLAPVYESTTPVMRNGSEDPNTVNATQKSGLPYNATYAVFDAYSSVSSSSSPDSISNLGLSSSGNVSYSNLTSYSESQRHTVQGESRVLYAYMISAFLTVASAIPFLILFLLTQRRRRQNQSQVEVKVDESPKRNGLPLKMYIFLTGLISAFYFFYTSVDDSFAQYLSVFVVTQLSWTKQKGAEVSSLYWGSSTVTKLIMVFLVHHVRLSLVLMISTVGMIISLVMFSIVSYYSIHSMVWISTALLALSQSAVFGGGFTWADSELIRFDGKVTSSVMIFCSLGAMATPLLLGFMMQQLSPMALPYLLTGQAFLTFVLFFLMLVVVKPIVWKTYGPPRPQAEITVGDVPRVETETTIAKENSEEAKYLVPAATSNGRKLNAGENSCQL